MNAPDLFHRRATRDDHAQLMKLIAAYYAFDHIAFEEPVMRQGLTAFLAGENFGRAYLLESQGQVVGYVLFTYGYDLEFGGRLATITDLYLEPEFRRRGFGSATLDFVGRECSRLGVRALQLEVEQGNLAAQALYRKVGFRSIARLPMVRAL